MVSRSAECSCGQLRVAALGEPIRISMCHCLACQKRTGSAFSIQARFSREHISITGRGKAFVRTADSGNKVTFNFCPECGSTVYYWLEDAPDTMVIPVGAFADPKFPRPTISVYGSRRHAWVELPEDMEYLE